MHCRIIASHVYTIYYIEYGRRKLYSIFYNIYHVRRSGAVGRFPVIRKVYNIILHHRETMGRSKLRR